MKPFLREWVRRLRALPHARSVLIGVFLVLSLGGISWWGHSSILLKVDGAAKKVHRVGSTVGDVLAAQQIVLGPEDFATPPPSMPLSGQSIIQVTRVTHQTAVNVRRFEPKILWRVQLKTNLRPVLVERGYVQIDSETVRATYYDGVETTRNVLKRKSFRQPVFNLTLFHRKTGRPVKTYNLAKARKLVMRATGYYVGEKYVPSDTTYLGYKLRRGLVAVDPKVIPLRSRLYVKGYGYAYAADTGSAIKGNRIDLAVKDRKEEQLFNRHKMTVYVLDKSSSW